jgi:hypothetical protein
MQQFNMQSPPIQPPPHSSVEYVLDEPGDGILSEIMPSNITYHSFYSLNALNIATSYIKIQLNSTGETKRKNLDTFRNIIQNLPKVQHRGSVYIFALLSIIFLILWYFVSQNKPDIEVTSTSANNTKQINTISSIYLLYIALGLAAIGISIYLFYDENYTRKEGLLLYNNIIQKLDFIVNTGKTPQQVYENLNNEMCSASYFTLDGTFIANFPFGININNTKLDPTVSKSLNTAVAINALSTMFGNNNNPNNFRNIRR